ncbi:hypothetical protein BC629DRAFT_285563 [Irpex lacteus]|nr:hypothetical protein BC629DRAFT_285563 [Irpex lacteus]
MTHTAQPQSYFFPSTPSAPHAFNLFAFSHSPRENHAVYEDLRDVFRGRSPSSSDDSDSDREEDEQTGRVLKKSASVPSFKDSLRKLLRLG